MNFDSVATVPTPALLVRALDCVATASRRSAAMHLALPVTDVAGVHALDDGRHWRWRGITVPSPRMGDEAVAAAALIAAGARPGDRFLDLEAANPALWVKPLRSGSHNVLFGAELVLGMPPLVADVRLPEPVLRSALQRLAVSGAARREALLADVGLALQPLGQHQLLTYASSGMCVTGVDGAPSLLRTAQAVADDLQGYVVSVSPHAEMTALHGADVEVDTCIGTVVVPVQIRPGSFTAGLSRAERSRLAAFRPAQQEQIRICSPEWSLAGLAPNGLAAARHAPSGMCVWLPVPLPA